MKRTPLWVFVAAVGLQIGALCLVVWAMESLGARDDEPAEDESADEPRPEPPRRAATALDPAPAHVEAPRPAAPAPEPPRPRFGPPPAGEVNGATTVASAEPLRPEPPRPEPPRPEPPRAEPFTIAAEPVPLDGRGLQFVTEAADDNAQLLQGLSADRLVAFGFYDDGNIRFVDVDGGRYAGKAESARARMREIDGTRALTVQIGIAADGRLQATFTGGLHDSETLALEPLVGWSIA